MTAKALNLLLLRFQFPSISNEREKLARITRFDEKAIKVMISTFYIERTEEERETEGLFSKLKN